MGVECTLCASKGKIGSGYEFKFNEVRNAIFHDRPPITLYFHSKYQTLFNSEAFGILPKVHQP